MMCRGMRLRNYNAQPRHRVRHEEEDEPVAVAAYFISRGLAVEIDLIKWLDYYRF